MTRNEKVRACFGHGWSMSHERILGLAKDPGEAGVGG